MYNFEHMSRKELRHAIKRADPIIFEDVLQFLEDHPRTFGSGYKREKFWKYIKRYDLTSSHIQRLEDAAIQYLYRPMSREFKYMCQTMCRLATDSFWERVQAEITSDHQWAAINAPCLYAYSDGMKAGETKRLAWKYRRDRWVRTNEKLYYTEDELANLIILPQHWHSGRILYCEPNTNDIPIVHFNPSNDYKFAKLDIAKANKTSLLQLFSIILNTGTLRIFTLKTWIYTMYLLHRIDDERVIPMISQFITTKLDYKFESPAKDYMMMCALKVLRLYNTDPAVSVIHKFQSYDDLYRNYYPDHSEYGWLASYPS